MNDTVSIADRAVKAKKEAEELRQAAINELTKQREDIDKKLAELEQTAAGQATNDGKAKGQKKLAELEQTATGQATKDGKRKGKGKNPCKVCGGAEHDGRAHRRSNLVPDSKQEAVQQNEELPIHSAQS